MAWSRLLSVSDTLNAPASASDQLWRISFFIKTIKSVCIEESWNGLPLCTKSSLLSCTSYSIYHCCRDRSEQRCNLTIPYIRPRWRASACLPIQPRLSLTPHCGTPEETHPHLCTWSAWELMIHGAALGYWGWDPTHKSFSSPSELSWYVIRI